MTSFLDNYYPQVADCADPSQVGNQDEAVAFIRRKTRIGKDFFELRCRNVGHYLGLQDEAYDWEKETNPLL